MKMNKKIVMFFILGFIILIATITNPKVDIHISKVKNILEAQLNSTKDSMGQNLNPDRSFFVNSLRYKIERSSIERLFNKTVKYENWIIFSVSKVRYGKGEILMGIGVFGNIYTPNVEYFLNEIKNEVKNVQKRFKGIEFNRNMNKNTEVDEETIERRPRAKDDILKKYGKK